MGGGMAGTCDEASRPLADKHLCGAGRLIRNRAVPGRGIASRTRCREEGRQTMSYSMSTLLTRNIHDVFG
jgi:hypothetical protein